MIIIDTFCYCLSLLLTKQITNGKEGIVVTELIQEDGEPRYKITDIIGIIINQQSCIIVGIIMYNIGKKDGIGVENLRGSGMIAGETSLAYDKIVTLNLVSVIMESSFVTLGF